MIEYHALQKLTIEEKVRLIKMDHRYFLLLEEPCAILKCVYSEEFNSKVIKENDLYTDLYSKGILSFSTISKKLFEEQPTISEVMKELNVYKSNAIDFIKE